MPDMSVVSPPKRLPPKPVVTIEGLTVIGGPAPIKQYGRGLFSEGQSNKLWPFVHGSKMIGVILDEYVCKGKIAWYAGSDCKYNGTHYWVADPAAGELRYRGKLSSRVTATKEITRKDVQRVAAQVSATKEKDVGYGTPPKRTRSTG